MGKIKLLDCTLRDGGYINNWAFGEREIPEMIQKLEESKVDILEVGFLKDEPYQTDRTVFNDMAQISALIAPKKKGIDYAAMIEVVNPIPLEMLAPCGDDTVDLLIQNALYELFFPLNIIVCGYNNYFTGMKRTGVADTADQIRSHSGCCFRNDQTDQITAGSFQAFCKFIGSEIGRGDSFLYFFARTF